MSLISVIRRITAHSTGPKRRRMPALCLFSTLLSSIALTRSREYLLQRLIKENSHRHSGCWGTFAGQQRSITHFNDFCSGGDERTCSNPMLAHQRTKRIKSRKTKNIPANPKIQKSNLWKETEMPAHKKRPKYQRAENRRSQNAKGAHTKEPKKQVTEGGTKIKEPKKQEPKEATQPLCPNFNNKMNLSSRAYPFKPD